MRALWVVAVLSVIDEALATTHRLPVAQLGGSRLAVPALLPALGRGARAKRLRGGSSSMAMLALPPIDPAVARLTCESMTELLTSCAIGWAAARTGLVDAAAIRSMAKVAFNIT